MSCLVTVIFLAERRLGLARETNSIYKTLSSYVISQLCRVCVCVCKILCTLSVLSPPSPVVVMREGYQRDKCQMFQSLLLLSLIHFNELTKKTLLLWIQFVGSTFRICHKMFLMGHIALWDGAIFELVASYSPFVNIFPWLQTHQPFFCTYWSARTSQWKRERN